MSLYYQDDHVTLYHGDCLTEYREWLTADVLVTDPPYGTQFSADNAKGGYGRRQNAAGNSRHASTGKNNSSAGFTIAGDSTTATRDAALAAWGNKPAIAFGSPRLPDPPGHWDDRLVWDKKRPGMNGGPFRYTHESIYARGMVRANNGTFSVYTIYPDQTDHIHAKPVALMTALMATCPPGIIADPFSGSGSTLMAAKNLGRKVIGVELEEKYCEIIAKRCAQDVFDFSEVTP